MMKSPLLLFAMEQESQDVFNDYNVLHTGIGKVNASYTLTKHLNTNNRPSIIINLGTAGSRKHNGGTVINPTRFAQRDMDVTALGFAPFQTPFSNDPIEINHSIRAEHLPDGICGSGDNFDTGMHSGIFDVVDMEAYALALICQREDIPFLCLKYISDSADENANEDWNTTLNRAANALHGALKEIL